MKHVINNILHYEHNYILDINDIACSQLIYLYPLGFHNALAMYRKPFINKIGNGCQ